MQSRPISAPARFSLTTLLAAFLLAPLPPGPALGAGPALTFCNPLDLPYNFQEQPPSRREAADPAVLVCRGEFWLFASKSGGDWHSRDFLHWPFVVPTGLPLDDYFPSHGGLLYAVALMAAGWDGAPARHAPGFPDNGQ